MDPIFPALAFFGMGDTELLLVMVAILIFFGGDKLPDFARGLGKAIRELKRATSDVEREFKKVIDEAEHPPAPPAFSPRPAPDAISRAEAPRPESLPPPVDPAAPPAPAGDPRPIPPPPPESEFHSDI